MTMHRIANTFRDSLNTKFGFPQIQPSVGESFDVNNDLHLFDINTVMHRDGHVTKGSPASVTHDSLIDYNRRHMSADAFADHYADDPTENGFGY